MNLSTPSTAAVSISVLIPNYNHAHLLPASLESVLNQSVQPEAIYVVDDASKDNSVEIIRRYCQKHSHLHLIENETNKGVNPNLNDFVARASTTHIFPLGADDYMLPGYIEGAFGILSKHPTAGICTAETLYLMESGEQKVEKLGWSKAPAFIEPTRLAKVGRGHFTGQCFYLAEGLRQIGGFRPELRWHSDHFAAWTLALRHGACYLPSPGAAFRVSSTSYSAVGINGGLQREVLANTLKYFNRPEMADVKPLLRDAHVLWVFENSLLAGLKRDPVNRYFLCPSFLRMMAWRAARRVVRHPVPPGLKEWFRKKRKGLE